jgi:Flp pilus assembly pilin Flp
MRELLLRFHIDEGGQGLVEYVLTIALIAFGAVTSMSTLASTVNSGFAQIGSTLTSALA